MEFNWGVFWALLAVLAIVVGALAIRALWRAMHARAAKVSSPEYLINEAFQGKRPFKPAPPLEELSVDELKREYQALRDLETALTKKMALETRDNPSASREQVIDAAVNAFTAGAFTKEEMEAMIREANARKL
ncbi:MAG TPA: hypothetical protein VEI73_03385 [Candidatus Acidoferrum sp.]|nr:hypothetical protein [Candidatus Acidoferrum sp.]